MKTTVEIKVSVDIEDVYNELSCADQEQFLVNHATDIAGELDTVAATWFNDYEVKEFVEDNIDKLSDEALIQEVKSRALEV
ncbi:hypothetical protein BFS16_00640 [Hoylesella timonensis]|uniref:Uncharacterized protein n=1 Tax=Hoylesella timonensis TaxID=386414 RepID=A0A2K0XPF6_9BACT|nr:hypothetical protein [Hoylesella timonensis]PNP96425.1 hypothetical protein BFS16_00640 [Hoylesella timonensis]